MTHTRLRRLLTAIWVVGAGAALYMYFFHRDGVEDALAGATPDTVRVRNEAGTKGDGRVYRISFEGDDGREGICSGTVKVSAPRRGVAIDSAPPSYNSFG